MLISCRAASLGWTKGLLWRGSVLIPKPNLIPPVEKQKEISQDLK